ncbi:MAG: hypothetical protein WBB25_07280 [Sulfitobacter sp.]
MQLEDIEMRAGQIKERCENARRDERLGLRPEVARIIRTLKEHRQPVPRALSRLEELLDEEAYDDMFENMPV